MKRPTLAARLRSDKRTRDAYTAACAFVALYCWYTAFWDNVNLVNRTASLGLVFNDVLGLFQIACVASVMFGFFFIKGKYLSAPRPVWIAVHVLAFAFTQLLMLAPTKDLMLAGAITGGLCIGLVGYRLFYSMFFYISKPSPVRAVAIAYLFIQTYIYIYMLAPVEKYPVLFFLLQAVTLLFSLGLGLIFRGNDVEARYSLRENHFQLHDTWPALAFVAAFQICLSLYHGIIVPQLPKDFWLDAYQIIPNTVTLVLMLCFSRFFSITNTIRFFLLMIVCGFISFLALAHESRLLVDTFIQPAYLFADVFYIWLIYSVFFTYGNKYFKLRLFLCLNAAVHYVSLIAVKAGDSWFTSHPDTALFALPFILGLFLLVPAVDTFIKKINEQRSYIESRKEKQVLLPPEDTDIRVMRERFLSTLYPDTVFSQREQDVLSYLIDDHSEEMIAFYMNIRQHEVRAAVKGILSKCCVRTKAELMMRIGQLGKEKDPAVNIDEILIRYSLTNREMEVCRLLLAGKSIKQAAAELHISFSTANSHYKSIYRKLGVSSRAELLGLFIPLP